MSTPRSSGSRGRTVCLSLIPAGLALVGLARAPVPPAVPEAAAVTAIVHVDIPDLEGGDPLRDHTVLVSGDRITLVAPSGDVPVPRGARVVDGDGRFLIPGLCDMHVHVEEDPAEDFSLFLANGVTTVRNMCGDDGGWDHVALREKVANGELLGPTYLTAGPFVDGSSAGSLEDLRSLLRVYETGGYDYIKVHGDLSPAVFETLLVESERMGLPVVGHMQREQQPQVSVRMKSISHMEEFLYVMPWSVIGDTTRHRDLAERVAATGITVSPTLRIYGVIAEYLDDAALVRLGENPSSVYLPRDRREAWLSDGNEYRDPDGGYLRFMMSAFSTLDPAEARSLALGKTLRRFRIMKRFTAAMQQGGVPLIAGSDDFGLVAPGFGLHEELVILVEAGLTPPEALRSATVNVARYLDREDRAGTVAEGKIADLVLLGADPTADIRNTTSIRGVMTRGRWLDRDALDAMLEAVRDSRNRTSDPGAASPEPGQ